MKKQTEDFWYAVNKITMILAIMIAIPLVIGEIFGYSFLENFLRNLPIPMSFDVYIVIGLICSAMLFLSFYLLERPQQKNKKERSDERKERKETKRKKRP